jgi:hypothetical protein
MDFTAPTLEALNELLSSSKLDEDGSEASEFVPSGPTPANPTAGEDPLFPTIIKSNSLQSSSTPSFDPKSIWSYEELIEYSQLTDDPTDKRPKPNFEFLLGQSLTSEDIYMNFGLKDSSSSSCNRLLIKVFLPDTRANQITLDLESDKFLLKCPKWKLFLYYPEKLEKNSIKCKFIADKQTLIIEGTIIKQFGI